MPRPSPALRALVETVAPSAATLGDEEWAAVARQVDAALADRPALERAQARLFLAALELLPLVTDGRRFSRLPAAGRARVLDGLSRSRLRLVRVGAWGVRTLALLAVYGRVEAWGALGYRPDRRGWGAAA